MSDPATAQSVQDCFSIKLKIYYEDTDLSGVVYHANYLKFFERARTDWVRAKGLIQDQMLSQKGLAFTVADIQLQFKIPARLDDELTITVAPADTRRASIVFDQEAWRGEQCLATARVRVACVDVRNFRPRPLPVVLSPGRNP